MMRSIALSALACTLLGVPHAGAEDEVGAASQPASPPQVTSSPANVNITPRVRPTGEEGADSAVDRRVDLRIDTTIVQIPVSVTLAQTGKLVTGLEVENFELFEDKVKQSITSFTSEDAPISVGIVFDASNSMGAKLSKAREAVGQFMRTANPQDEFFLIQFHDRPQLVVPFTADTVEIINRLSFVQPKGRTALLDGVYMAMNEMKKARNGRKAILIISDGGDNSSRYTESEVKNAVREADVQIYAIGIFEPYGGRFRTPEEMSGPGLLGEVTEQTGGRHFAVENLAELPDIAAKIGLELRNEYVLGYTSTNAARDGKFRKVEVKLVKTNGLPRLNARFRNGYYAQAQ